MHPGRLVTGLAAAVERRGVTIYEGTRATSLDQGRVRTEHGTLRAGVVVRATEGYTRTLRGRRRELAPVYSLIIATEPLPPETWERIGLRRRETWSDQRHVIIYGQRTADDRMVFGGRGAPYHFGSAIKPGFDRDARVFAALRATLVDLFPVLSSARIEHAWGGALGVPRDWCASVGLDRATGLAWAGGYVGDGVSTTNLAGRTLRDLVLGHDTDLTRAALGRAPLAEVGARAAALAGRERRPARDAARRRRGGPHRPAQPGGPRDGAVAGRSLRCVGRCGRSWPPGSWSHCDGIAARPAKRIPGSPPRGAPDGARGPGARSREPTLGHRLGFTEVRLSAPSGRRVVVEISTRSGTAKAGRDFVPLHPTVVFAPGETSAVVSVEMLADDRDEPTEKLRLAITEVRHAEAVRGGRIRILDAPGG